MSTEGSPSHVALKFVGGGRGSDRSQVDLLREEVKALLPVKHPNIVRVYSWHDTPGQAVFYSMEFVPGVNLKELLQLQPAGRFSCQQLQPLLEQLFNALEYAHVQMGLVHRDIKPANLMVTPKGNLILADFGLARPDSTGDIYATTIGGTLLYASPAQRRGAAPSVSDDIYSLAAALYHLLTGHPPFSAEQLTSGSTLSAPHHPWHYLPRQDRRQVTAEASSTLLQCLSAGTGDPPPDIATFRKWWRSGPPVDARRVDYLEPLRRLLQGFMTVSGFLATLYALLVLTHLNKVQLPDPLQGPWVTRPAERLRNWLRPLARPPEDEKNPPKIQVPEPVSGASDPVMTSTPVVLPATLTLILEPYYEVRGRRHQQPGDVRVYVSRGSETGWVNALRQEYEVFPTSSELTLKNLPPALYRIEAEDRLLTVAGAPVPVGVKHGKRCILREVQLDSGQLTRIPLDFKPSLIHVRLSSPVQFLIYDSWSNPLFNGPLSFDTQPAADPAAPIKADLPFDIDQEATLRAGRYRLELPAKALAAMRVDPVEPIEFWLEPGVPNERVVLLKPWTHPRMSAEWSLTNLQLRLLPMSPPTNFLGGEHEVTVSQFREFAEQSKMADMPLESVTSEGFVKIGRTWRNAFERQEGNHPVVGVSWEEAMNFCSWLTKQERGKERLMPQQRFTLPAAEQWETMVGVSEYPWGGTYPPKPEEGNYAGRELLGPNWPRQWRELLLTSADASSKYTVPVSVGRSHSGFRHLGGNVAEWCDTWYQPELNARIPWRYPSRRLSTDDSGTMYRVVRGASWADSDDDLLRTAACWAELPDHRSDRVGFRIILVEGP